MQSSTHRSSRGKARAAEGDYAQAFASLSLSDYDDHPTSRNNSYESSYPVVYGSYGSSYEQPYSGDDQYGWTQSSQSSSAAYSGTPGYGNSYPTTSATSSTEGYDYRNESSGTSNYGSYAGYDTAPVTPWTHSNRTDINNTINRQRPPNERYQLPCEFHNITNCDRVFTGDDVQRWMDHVEEHLQSKFPTRLRCWFCSDRRFDARETTGGNVRSNFITRMEHIRDHFVYDGFRREQSMKDGYLLQHLLGHELIDRRTYESIINPTVPPMRASRLGHGRRGHHRLPQVEEEGVAESSSRHHRRSEKDSHVGDETATDTVVNALHRPNVGYFGEASSDSPGRVRLLQSEDRANVGLPSSSRDASTPESGSFWLEEYSEDEDNKLDEDHPFNQYRALAVARVFKASHSWRESYSEQDTPYDGVEEANPSSNKDTGKEKDSETGKRKRADQSETNKGKDNSNRPSSNHTPDEDNGKGKDSGTGKWKRADQSETNNSKDNSNRPSFNPTLNEDKGKGTDSGKRADQSETSNGKDNSNGPSSSRAGCSKRRRTSDRQLTFACPYTKKDPMSYRDCYRYKLSRIRDVKQHLVRCHRNPPYCPRCMDTFETEEERDEHIRQSSCPLRPSVRLDGITESQRSQLAKKSASNISPEAQWFAVFEILFPEHNSRPLSPYVDSELLQDITLYQDFLTSHGPRILSRVLDEQGVVTWHLPNEERDLAASRQEIFEEGLREVFDQWVARGSSSSSDPSVTSSSGGTTQNTPPSSSNSGERLDSTSAHDSTAGPPESSGNRSGGGPADAHLDTEHLQEASSDQIPLGEVLDESLILEHGNSDFLSGLTYGGLDDELTRFFMDG